MSKAKYALVYLIATLDFAQRSVHANKVSNDTDKVMELKDKVLEEYEKGKIVVVGAEGLICMDLKQFIEQPTDGMLYDLNRSEEVVLTFINDPKWVNDYAVCQTIRALKAKIDELERELA